MDCRRKGSFGANSGSRAVRAVGGFRKNKNPRRRKVRPRVSRKIRVRTRPARRPCENRKRRVGRRRPRLGVCACQKNRGGKIARRFRRAVQIGGVLLRDVRRRPQGAGRLHEVRNRRRIRRVHRGVSVEPVGRVCAFQKDLRRSCGIRKRARSAVSRRNQGASVGGRFRPRRAGFRAFGGFGESAQALGFAPVRVGASRLARLVPRGRNAARHA